MKEKNQKNKKKKWIKWRHRLVRNLAYAVLYPYSRLKYGIRITKFLEQGDRPYLILLNHQTAFDQFFVGMAFKGPVYYVASEDLFSMGKVSDLLRYLVAPIPIKKQTQDARAVITCARVAKEGGTIAVAPEGNRTYSGVTEYIKPSIVGLVRFLRLPVAFYKIEGGFGVQPRWSDVVRRGTVRGGVSCVMEPEEYKSMSDDELYARICKELYVDEYKIEETYRHKKRAEYLERAIYVCPKCGLSEFESCGDLITCKKCGLQARYGEDKKLTGVGEEFPYSTVTQWYQSQIDFVNRLDLDLYENQPIYRETMELSRVILYHGKQLLRKQADWRMYGNRFVVDEGTEQELVLPFSELSVVTVLGKNKLNVYHGEDVYQLKGSKRMNALKYMNLYYRHKNLTEEVEDREFLGL